MSMYVFCIYIYIYIYAYIYIYIHMSRPLYFGSPTSGKPMCARWHRIWWVLPAHIIIIFATIDYHHY